MVRHTLRGTVFLMLALVCFALFMWPLALMFGVLAILSLFRVSWAFVMLPGRWLRRF